MFLVKVIHYKREHSTEKNWRIDMSNNRQWASVLEIYFKLMLSFHLLPFNPFQFTPWRRGLNALDLGHF